MYLQYVRLKYATALATAEEIRFLVFLKSAYLISELIFEFKNMEFFLLASNFIKNSNFVLWGGVDWPYKELGFLGGPYVNRTLLPIMTFFFLVSPDFCHKFSEKLINNLRPIDPYQNALYCSSMN
jgi:hypothetical protein